MATTKATNLGHRSDVTLKGTTTTVESNVVLSDTTTINNAGSDVGLKINSTSSGHIMQLQDNGTDVMVVEDGGNVGIGETDLSASARVTITPSAQASDLTESILNIGGVEADDAVGTKNSIGFGYSSTARPIAPAMIGMETMTTTGGTYGDLYFATRNVTTNTAPTERMRINSSGNVGIGETSPSALLHLKHSSPNFYMEDSDTSRYGNISYGTRAWNFDNTMDSGEDMDNVAPWFYFRFTDANETRQVMKINYDTYITGDFVDTSDIGLKENITKISSGLDVVNQLNPVEFDWKNPAKGRSSGFIAQEIELILPNNVSGEDYNEEDDTSMGKAINTIGIVAHLTKAIQELSAKVTALENA